MPKPRRKVHPEAATGSVNCLARHISHCPLDVVSVTWKNKAYDVYRRLHGCNKLVVRRQNGSARLHIGIVTNPPYHVVAAAVRAFEILDIERIHES